MPHACVYTTAGCIVHKTIADACVCVCACAQSTSIGRRRVDKKKQNHTHKLCQYASRTSSSSSSCPTCMRKSICTHTRGCVCVFLCVLLFCFMITRACAHASAYAHTPESFFDTERACVVAVNERTTRSPRISRSYHSAFAYSLIHHAACARARVCVCVRGLIISHRFSSRARTHTHTHTHWAQRRPPCGMCMPFTG